jgi:hypothetical protein
MARILNWEVYVDLVRAGYVRCSERRLIGHSFYRGNFLRNSCATCREKKSRRAAPRTDKPAQWTTCTSNCMTTASKVGWLFPLSLSLIDHLISHSLSFSYRYISKTSPMTRLYSNIEYTNPASVKLKLLSNWLMTQSGWTREPRVIHPPRTSSC